MQRRDVICRVAVFPRLVSSGVFDEEQFLNFVSIDAKKTTYVTSVVSKFLIRNEANVHSYGEGVAKAGNTRLASRNSGEVPSDKENFYLGFYNFEYGAVVNVRMEYYSIQVRWRPENDCDAHFQIEMLQSEISGTKGQRRRDRTAAVHEMSKTMSGPVCPEFCAGTKEAGLLGILPVNNPLSS